MGKHEKPAFPLYERDFMRWTQDQASKLRKRAHNEIDWENVAEEIESLGRSDRREIESRLAVLIAHLLKWEFQPGKRSNSWQSSISEQRIWIEKLIKNSPSLRNYPDQILDEAYEDALRLAVRDTGLRRSHFPETPPFGSKQALDSAFWPGEPLSRLDILLD